MKKTLNNKGFTLIEIIGIVVILAVIMIVTVPALENTLRNSSKKNFDNFMKNLSLAAENYIVDNKMISEDKVCVSLETLLNDNYIDEIPSNPSDDPFGTGESLNNTDEVCGTKDTSTGIFTYQVCSSGTCIDLKPEEQENPNYSGEIIVQNKSFLDMDRFKQISYRNDNTIKNMYFVKSVDTTNAVDGSVIDLSKNQDGTITGWAIANVDGTYDYYVGSEDTICSGDLSGAFSDMTQLVSISFGNFDTSFVTNMSSMFYNTGLTSLDLSSFNTSNVTNMSYMFSEMHNLEELDISSFTFSGDVVWTVLAEDTLTPTVYVKSETEKNLLETIMMKGANVVVGSS